MTLRSWVDADGGVYFSEYQRFWRCAHHPVATDNFFANRTTCEHDCDMQELKWFHNGEHPLPAITKRAVNF